VLAGVRGQPWYYFKRASCRGLEIEKKKKKCAHLAELLKTEKEATMLLLCPWHSCIKDDDGGEGGEAV
jgi:hypothetical protein